MKRQLVFVCLLVTAALAAKDKKINLEDIEKDNLKSERKAKQESKPTPASIYTQTKPPPVHYGFVPMKTGENYPRSYPQTQQQYAPQPQYVQQYYAYQPQAQQYQHYQPQYQPQYQQYENVPLVTDNSIGQSYQQQQYFTPQYVYVQPAASTSVQSVVDPKGGVQYVMYIPTYPKGQESAYQNLIQGQEYTQTYVPQQEYTYDLASDPQYAKLLAAQKPEIQYVQQTYAQPQKTIADYAQQDAPAYPKEYAQVVAQLQAQKGAYVTQQAAPPPPPQVEYVTQAAPHVEYVTQAAPQVEYVPKKEPKSLLDSYVPSYLQLQYYKQKQLAQENQLRYYSKQQQQPEELYYKQQVDDNSVQQSKPRPIKTQTKLAGYKTPSSGSRVHHHQPTYSVQVVKE